MKLFDRLNRPAKGTPRDEAKAALQSAEADLARVQRQAPLVEAYASRFRLVEDRFSESAIEAMRRTA